MEILRGMEVKITGVIHRLIFLKKRNLNFFLIFFFFWGGGGGHICANYWGGGTAPHAPPIPTALYHTSPVEPMLKKCDISTIIHSFESAGKMCDSWRHLILENAGIRGVRRCNAVFTL